MATLTLKSGGEEFAFIMPFNAVCYLVGASSRVVNGLCDNTRSKGTVVQFPTRKKKGRR